MSRPILTRNAARVALLTLALLGGGAGAVRIFGDDPPAKPGPLPPDKALATLHTPEDLKVEQVLAEPEVRQPVFLNFDERGRLWVVNYLQYPDPAGLTMLSRDGVWRAVYDKVPPPPPHHFRGADKITIHEDTDGDGRFDRQKTFIDGLNITTAVERGRGGVWVLNPPYLLFYPDRDNDDVPDGDPEVHLQGFGLEDTHSVVNSLCWGPDGWLYAAQGSTVTGHVTHPGTEDEPPMHSMGQLIWRYHPESRRYEVFAEGGGNAFGVEIDSKGRTFSGHNGGDTRGFHYVQGGYYQKGFSKHGPLSNPYTFGYFPAMKHNNVPRFTHTFVIYEGETLPARYRGKLFGAAPLLNHVVISDVERDGSSIRTHDIGHAITSDDPWFRPVDIKHGPDGALYVADWYDGQVNHYLNHEGQIDKENGRVYRIEPLDYQPVGLFDLSKKSSDELVDLLKHPNRWYRRMALRLLGDRKDRDLIPRLREMVQEAEGQDALEALWALNLSGGFDDGVAVQLLKHSDPYVRLWATRLACDKNRVSPDLAAALAERAKIDPDVEVRSQLACSARRLPASEAMPIVRGLLGHEEDVEDIHLPLLLWWAIEAKAASDRDAVLDLFREPDVWRLPLVERHINERLMRRYASAGTLEDLQTCATLLSLAPDDRQRKQLMTGFETALAGRALPASLPPELAEAIDRFGGGSLLLGLRQRKPEAVAGALKALADPSADRSLQLQYIQILGDVEVKESLPILLDLACKSSDAAIQGAAIRALARYRGENISDRVLAVIPNMSDDLRAEAFALLSRRPEWGRALLKAIDEGQVEARSVPPAAVQALRLQTDETLAGLVTKHFGSATAGDGAAVQARIDAISATIQGGTGVPKAGKALFDTKCATCHTLFGDGGKVGPDLTTYQRGDLETMLLNIVHPSAEVREGFETMLVATSDGRALSGTLIDQDDHVIVLRGADGDLLTIGRDEIDEQAQSQTSLMPEGLLDDLDPQQVRDLFAYLRSTQPNID